MDLPAWAVYHNQANLVELLIRAKCNVNASTRYKVTPLAVAVTHREKLPPTRVGGEQRRFATLKRDKRVSLLCVVISQLRH